MLYISAFTFVAAALVSLNIAKPIVFSRIVDFGILQKDLTVVAIHCSLFASIALALALFSTGHFILSSVLSNRLGVAIRQSVLGRLLDLDCDYYVRTSTGDTLTRVNNDVESIQGYIMTLMNNSMNNLFSFAAAMIYIGFVQWKMLVVGFVVTPFVALALYLLRNILYKTDKSVREARSASNDVIVQSLAQIVNLRLLNVDVAFRERIYNSIGIMKSALIRHDSWLGGSRATNTLIMALGYVVTIGYGATLVADDSLSVGHLFAFLTLRSRFLGPIGLFEDAYRGFHTTKAAVFRLAELFAYPIELGITIVQPKSRFTKVHYLSFNGITVGYDGASNLLENVDISFERAWYGIFGENGTGKSTLFEIIAKIKQPRSGTIVVDGNNLAEFNNRWWRSHISFVRQQPFLFKGTLRENLRLFRDSVGDEEILAVIGGVSFENDLNRLPLGLETEIAEDGQDFSRGQCQKIAMARAVLADSPIVLLDEPLAFIDQNARTRVLNFLSERLHDRVVLIISHENVSDFVDFEYELKDHSLIVNR